MASSRNRNADLKRAVVDDLFKKREHRKLRVSMLKEREQEADTLGLVGRQAGGHITSKPVSFADDAIGATMGENALANAETTKDLLPVDDPDFSVLTDDDFSYFPSDDTRSQAAQRVVPGEALVAPGMRRYRLELQYRGDHFLGWNRAAEMRRRRKALAVKLGEVETLEQAENVTWAGHALTGLRSAKDAVEEALAVALDMSSVTVVPSVVLETGVHARRLTCHVDIPADTVMQSRTILQRAHAWLASRGGDGGEPLGILSFQRAPPDFHAAQSTTRRIYVYRIMNRISPPVFDVGQHWHLDRFLDTDVMSSVAVSLLQGTHDFGAFAARPVIRAVRSNGTMATVRTIDEIRVTRQDDEVLIWFVGKSFLRHQLRHLVGALKMVGQGVLKEEELRLLFEQGFSAKRSAERERPPMAPAHGLTLWEVEFPAALGVTPEYVDSGPLPLTKEESAP
jgi:tRNA pseudouridine(38-40) synthase